MSHGKSQYYWVDPSPTYMFEEIDFSKLLCLNDQANHNINKFATLRCKTNHAKKKCHLLQLIIKKSLTSIGPKMCTHPKPLHSFLSKLAKVPRRHHHQRSRSKHVPYDLTTWTSRMHLKTTGSAGGIQTGWLGWISFKFKKWWFGSFFWKKTKQTVVK